MKYFEVESNGITLSVSEMGEGPAVVFCHGFPDTSRTWWRQMGAVATAGYRAVAPDMRGFGGSSAPADPLLYTPYDTVGDLVGLLDALNIPSAVLVGHDWGANVAFHAALFRPDRFSAVFALSVPYSPRGTMSLLERLSSEGHGDTFYMLRHTRPGAEGEWADAASSIPGALYWSSGSPSAQLRWDPLDPARSLSRAAPLGEPSWAEPEYVAHNIAAFERTGFAGGLNYYKAIQPFFDRSAAFRGAPVRQPSYYLRGMEHGLSRIRNPTTAELLVGMPGLQKHVALEGVGHWPQHEATAQVNAALLSFLDKITAS